MQEKLKSNTTLCILSGIFEVIKDSDYYKLNFSPVTEAKIVKTRKILFSKVTYKIPGLNLGTHPFFIVKEYAPMIFQRLRLLEGPTKESFLQSLDVINNQKALFSLHIEQGGSGSMFIFTEDNHLVIKILQKSERNFFIKTLLQDYLDHIEKNCKSLLNRVYGVYTIKIPGLSPLDLILTQSLLKGDELKYYDIKGSSYNRITDTLEQLNFKGPYKDTDFISSDERLFLYNFDRAELRENILKDFKLLLDHGIMDYSLIVAIFIHKSDKCYYDEYKNRWYRFGVIDFLGEYSFKRKAEYYIKKLRHGKNIKLCSVMKPQSYYKRILEFLFTKVFLLNL